VITSTIRAQRSTESRYPVHDELVVAVTVEIYDVAKRHPMRRPIVA
jgi:hypothetical protein